MPFQCGEQNTANKLTAVQAIEIFESDASVRGLARRFGVHRSLVQQIKRGKIWRQVTSEKNPSTDG